MKNKALVSAVVYDVSQHRRVMILDCAKAVVREVRVSALSPVIFDSGRAKLKCYSGPDKAV